MLSLPPIAGSETIRRDLTPSQKKLSSLKRCTLQTESENRFWQLEIRYWLKQFNSSEAGLSEVAAARILARQGSKTQPASTFKKDLRLFIGQINNPLMLLLLGAVILSAFLSDISDVVIILLIVLSTSILSFLQERNAGKVVEQLQSLIAIKATVLRDGKPKEIPSAQVVSGDVLLVRAGDRLPADCLLLEANELHANESSLTGESFPVRKEAGMLPAETPLARRTNCLWEGTSIISGNGKALVIQTGGETLFGRLSVSAEKGTTTAFEHGIRDFGFFLLKITLLLAVFILIVNLLHHTGIIESALFALALAVGMAPELLPAITTIAMSRGAKKLLEKKVIVKKLNSIQNLGEVNLLCTDKTGTITEGAIHVAGWVDGQGRESVFVRKLAIWNASLENGYANPIDEALKKLAPSDAEVVQKIGEVPYDFIRKRLSIGVATGTENLLVSKGAFAQILPSCTKLRLSEDRIEEIAAYRLELENRFTEYGEQGLRVIAICYKPIDISTITKEMETEMIFAGFILLNDPVKSGIVETISQLHRLKVGLKIITGDNRAVADSITRDIGFHHPTILTGQELLATSPEALKQRVQQTNIFAEVEPQQKERIILALRQTFTVAYMGDGINDVAAITAADVGISVDNAVDVAREAADFVLMEKNLMVIADGIREGRKTFANTLKYLYISTGSTFGNMCSVAAASLVLPFLPMLPKQILLTNFLTDFPFLTVTTDNVDKEALENPGRWEIGVIRKYMVIFGAHSSLFDLLTFFTLDYLFKVKASEFQTGWFVESVLSELCILFIIRTHKRFFQSRPGIKVLVFSGVAFGLTIGLPYLPLARQTGLIPLPLGVFGTMLLIVATYIITADLLKVWFFRKNHLT